MYEDERVTRLQALDTIAAEMNMALALRVCEESGDLEPVFLRIHRANAGEANETTLIAIDDEHGLSLGRYVISRARLEEALDAAEDVEEDEAEPMLVPLDPDDSAPA